MTRFDFIGLGNFDAFCDIEIFLQDGYTIIVASEEDKNTGTSITNAAEILIQAVSDHYNISLQEMIWIEHYLDGNIETFETVHIKQDCNGKLEYPGWYSIQNLYYQDLISGKLRCSEIEDDKLLQG